MAIFNCQQVFILAACVHSGCGPGVHHGSGCSPRSATFAAQKFCRPEARPKLKPATGAGRDRSL